ncbi:MAG: CorA family divalent cation transporter [Candidatus Bathycorpusculaceae bacterium]
MKGKNLQAFDIHSIKELKEVNKKFNWVWLDCLEPSPKDFEPISQIVGFKPSELEELKGGKTFPHPRKVNEHIFFSISHVTIHGETLKTYPIYIFLNQKMLITLSKKESSAPIEHALQALKDSLPEGQNIGPSFILCEISQENTNKNLEAVMAFREVVEELEEKSIAKPSRESIKRCSHLKSRLLCFIAFYGTNSKS